MIFNSLSSIVLFVALILACGWLQIRTLKSQAALAVKLEIEHQLPPLVKAGVDAEMKRRAALDADDDLPDPDETPTPLAPPAANDQQPPQPPLPLRA